MKISIITLFPDLHTAFLQTSIIRNAVKSGKISVNLINLLQLAEPGCRVDEPTVGPGPGMILKPEIIQKALEQVQTLHGFGLTVFFTPKGQLLDQLLLNQLAEKILQQNSQGLNLPTEAQEAQTSTDSSFSTTTQHLILVCARYEGIDERVEQHYADLRLSIGDYVLMGGDLPAQVFLEGLLRLIPEIVGNQQSVANDSFQGPLFDHPEYGLPVEWNGQKVPEILFSGHHQQIKDYRRQAAIKSTLHERFDYLQTHPESLKLQQELIAQIPPHYVILMHSQVETGQGPGTTSVTSIDLHDIARSCATYSIKNFFVSTPLKDQQTIVQTFLDFWHSPEGIEYNMSRFNAVKHLKLVNNLSEAIDNIIEQTGKKPLIITTSAKSLEHQTQIDFFSQGQVWEQDTPILLIFGTGRGLAQEVIDQSDFLLVPVNGFSSYNHLSVRSAVAIILDRWLGFNPKRRALKMRSK